MQDLNVFFHAIQKGERESVGVYLDHEPELVNTLDPRSGLTPLMTALYYMEPEIAGLLIERGAGVNQFEAAAAGKMERLSALLDERPGGVNDFSPDGFQALGLAAFFGQDEAAELLLARGAEVNAPSRNRMQVCPLHSAVAARRLRIARALIEHGADVKAVQNDGFTPLMGAAQNGQIEMIELLLAHGARADALSANGQTATDLAHESGHAAAAALLQRHAGGKA
ncbi:MAG: ankyrin repeat domain-containing protein [Chloroflexi bacterium]|nr:ankyrin repeat domain-containing protein [Chloroflexota bacterium]